ncbi:CDP-glucose 4,6-dehydratase [Chitinophaga sp. 30R24]|uniref:CDP-glucose 4,6-dehydratase n=1 Tax=Chitinophaga sp. 30R24 TaxID=3248838 RepID=UPI003B915A97
MFSTEIYKNKKVFLTGHTGFKGSWLLVWLHFLGAKIKGFSLAPENQHDLYNQIGGDNLCDSIIGDIMDYDLLEKELLAFEPDFVFHLAAQPLVRLSYKMPVATFSINSIGSAHLLEVVRKLPGKCQVIMVTTDKVYHNNEWVYPYRETDALGGYDPYSASKACAEIVIASYRNSFFNLRDYSIHKKGIAVARAGNVIGGGDWALDRIIPDTIRALQQNIPVTVRNPKAVRPWQHVLEPLSGYLELGAKLFLEPEKYSTAFNFGPYMQDNLEVEALVKIALEIWQGGGYEIIQHQDQLHEAGLLKLDISKAVYDLLWTPKFSAEAAIEKTVNWYKAFSEGNSTAFDLVKKDIDAYVAA